LKLLSFRIQKYKRIEDTDWVTIGNFSGFVGKNEVGKSSIFRALSKIHPSDNEPFKKYEEIPRLEFNDLKNRTDLFPVSVKFQIEESDKIKSKKIPPVFILTRNYDNDYFIFDKDMNPLKFNVDDDFIEKIPKFIYFDSYDILQGDFNIPDFIQKSEANLHNRELRIQKCLFKHVGLDLKELKRLIPKKIDNMVKEGEAITAKHRAQLIQINLDLMDECKAICDTGANDMTKSFNEWWPLGKYIFEYQMNDENFKVYVKDENYDAPINLKNRSLGFKYFFSFFLIFLVESREDEDHSNSILLLDEPGLHYHGTLQLKLIPFFKELSKNNQIMYTTHIPFMIDPENYDDVFFVNQDEKTEGKTTILAKGILPKDDTIFPLEMSWYHSQFQNYIKNKPHVIVEGYTDEIIFNKINALMRYTGSDLENVIFIAVRGKRGSHTLLKILLYHEIKIIYFVDGDDGGKELKNTYESEFNLKGLDVKKYVKITSTIEDLIPQEYYLDAFFEVYGKKPTSEELSQCSDPRIVEKLKNYLDPGNNKLELKKPQITHKLLKIIERNPDVFRKKFEPIFKDIKKLIEHDDSFTGKLWSNGRPVKLHIVTSLELSNS